MQLSIHITSKSNSFLDQVIEKHGSVLYIDTELGQSGLNKRCEILFNQMIPELREDYQSSPFDFIPFSMAGTIDDVEKRRNKIKELIEEYNPVLVIIDNLKTFNFNQDFIKDAKGTGKFIHQMRNYSVKNNTALVLVQHTRKHTRDDRVSSDLASGSGSIADLQDADFFLRKVEGQDNMRVLVRDKARHFNESSKGYRISMEFPNPWFVLHGDWEPETFNIKSTISKKKVAVFIKPLNPDITNVRLASI